MIRATLLAFVLLLAAAPVAAEEPYVTVGGQVQHARTYSLRDLEKFPQTNVAIAFVTDKGSEAANYSGVSLWAVISDAQPVDAPGKNSKLRHTILVTGRDGYAVSISEGEIDPNFEGKSVILAIQKDNKPLDEGIRLVVPDDKHGGRAVRDVVRIDVQ